MEKILEDFYVHKNQMIKLIENTSFEKTTKALTEYIIEFFVKKELVIQREVKTRFHIDYKKPNKQYTRFISKSHRVGYIDLRVSKFMKSESILDIEIDRSNKRASLGKLIYSKNTLNHKVLWIRWGCGRYSMENSMKNLIDENEIPILYLF